jgi:Mitochondrial ribosomal subunit protein
MGEDHPAESKVVVSFSPSNSTLNLTPDQHAKLIKLAGARYNPSTDLIKMSCETFDTPAQNKRYLGDQVEVLLKEARDPADTFADVPFDFRHHRPKPVYTFPEEWKMTPERKAELVQARELAAAEAAVREKRSKEEQQQQQAELDGLMFTPDGARMREREKLKVGVLEREKNMLADPDLQKDQRVLLLERAQEREKLEQMLLVVDSRARRPSKRGVISPELLKMKKGGDLNKRLRT